MIRKISRLFVVFVATVVLTCLTTKASCATAPVVFEDMLPGDDNYDIVMYLAKHGVILGCSNGSFRPEDKVTAAELITMLERAFGSHDRLPVGWDWSTYNSNWFTAATENDYTDFRFKTTDKTVPAYMAAKYLLAILGESPESVKTLVSRFDYTGSFLGDSVEHTLTAAMRGYVPQYEEGYEETCGFKIFEDFTRRDAAVMIYMAMQEVL